jgi:hypothetical protein
MVHEAGGAGRFEGIAFVTTTVNQRRLPDRRVGLARLEGSRPQRHSKAHAEGVLAASARRAVLTAYGDLPDPLERQRMRRHHPVLLEVLTSTGFLGVVAVHGYLVTHLGWSGFLVGLVSGIAWGLMFTFGFPSWRQIGLQVLRGHGRDELFS